MAAATAKKPHVLGVPLPAQGHVKPLMSLCRQIAKHGVKVTIVNAQSIHDKLLSAAKTPDEDDDGIVLTSVPDGLSSDDDPNDPFVLFETLRRTMPDTLPDLIERINSSNPNERISCVIVDLFFGWVLEIAEKMGVEGVGFSSPSMASFDVMLRIPHLLQLGYLTQTDHSRILMKSRWLTEFQTGEKMSSLGTFQAIYTIKSPSLNFRKNAKLLTKLSYRYPILVMNSNPLLVNYTQISCQSDPYI